MKIQNILFDLDGTLTDPKTGITRSIQYALHMVGAAVPPAAELLWCIGPPLRESLLRLLPADQGLAETALAHYRERFNKIGKFENVVYPEISEVLTGLAAQGFNLFVATSKPLVFAAEIVAHFSLRPFFKGVYGSELNGDLTDKSELIYHILCSEKIAPKQTLMVGDRCYDILGAKKQGLLSLGITYGYGAKEELIESGADAIVDSPREILEAARLLGS